MLVVRQERGLQPRRISLAQRRQDEARFLAPLILKRKIRPITVDHRQLAAEDTKQGADEKRNVRIASEKREMNHGDAGSGRR